MKEFIAQNGKKICIGQPTFANALGLKNAIQKALVKNNINISEIDPEVFSEAKEDLKGASTGDVATLFQKYKKIIDLFIGGGFAIDSDPEVNKFILLCLERSTFDGERITEATFEIPEARCAYYEILFFCLKETLSPFFAPLFSKFKSVEKITSSSQKPQLPQLTAI